MEIWQRPDFVELCMNAEIGAYQEDTGDERETPPFLDHERAKASPSDITASGLVSQHVA